jgi:hypothetical protein
LVLRIRRGERLDRVAVRVACKVSRFGCSIKLRLTVPQVQTFGTELEWENLDQITTQNQRRRRPLHRNVFWKASARCKNPAIYDDLKLGLEPLVRFTDYATTGESLAEHSGINGV